MTVKSGLGLVAIVFVFGMLCINGFAMLISPRWYWSWPSWLRFSGSVWRRPDDSLAGDLQDIEMRVAGAMMVALVVCIVWSIIKHSNTP